MKLETEKRDLIIKLLREGELTKKEIGEEAGVSQPTIRKVEREMGKKRIMFDEIFFKEKEGFLKEIYSYTGEEYWSLDQWSESVEGQISTLFDEGAAEHKEFKSRIATLEKTILNLKTVNSYLYGLMVQHGWIPQPHVTT